MTGFGLDPDEKKKDCYPSVEEMKTARNQPPMMRPRGYQALSSNQLWNL